MPSETRGISLTPEQWEQLAEIAAKLDCVSVAGTRPGEHTPAALIRDIASGAVELTRVQPPQVPLAVRIRAMLAETSLTHREIAERLGCSASLVSKVSTGVRGKVTENQAERLAIPGHPPDEGADAGPEPEASGGKVRS